MSTTAIRRLPAAIFIALASLLVSSPASRAQTCNVAGNYVPNPGFECIDSCPSISADVFTLTDWENGHAPLLGTPDNFNACQSNGCDMGAPTNIYGTQTPHQGDGYAGLFVSQNDSGYIWREYIRANLLGTLTAGSRYKVSFYVSLAEGSPYSQGKIGAIVGEDIPLSTTFVHPIRTQDAYIESPTAITQTNGWVEVSGEFIASGGENTIVIGFFESTTSDRNARTSSSCGTFYYTSSAYYIDDISLVFVPCSDVGNLVPNSSFECKFDCPGTPGFFNSTPSYFNNTVEYWVNGHDAGLGTPDYYNACDTSTCSSGVPYNANGSEAAHTGHAYAGIAQFDYDAGWREYIHASLLSSLITGRRYVVKYYVSEAELSAFSAGVIGALVGTDIPLSTTMLHPIRVQDHYIPDTRVITRRNGWELVRGEFTATGHENTIVIGFFGDTLDTLRVNTASSCRAYIQGTNYVYIDDVSLQDCCDGITVTAKAANTPCSWDINVTQEADLGCIYAVEIVDGESYYDTPGSTPLSLNPELTVGTIQLHSTGKQNVVVRFLDVNGNVICMQAVEVDCKEEVK